MPVGESPVGLLGLTLTLALAATGLGMLVGSLARTSKQAGIIGMLLGFVLYFASGFTSFTINVTGGVAEANFPTEGFRFYLSQLTPHTHAINGYFKLMLDGADLVDIMPNILALLGFGVVFFLLGLWRFRYK
jgi:ABC-type multidrug transport system permease subunit